MEKTFQSVTVVKTKRQDQGPDPLADRPDHSGANRTASRSGPFPSTPAQMLLSQADFRRQSSQRARQRNSTAKRWSWDGCTTRRSTAGSGARGDLPWNPGDKVRRDPFEERTTRSEASRERTPREPSVNNSGQERRPRKSNQVGRTAAAAARHSWGSKAVAA